MLRGGVEGATELGCQVCDNDGIESRRPEVMTSHGLGESRRAPIAEKLVVSSEEWHKGHSETMMLVVRT